MYSNGISGLGEEPGFFDAGGTFESIAKVVSSGVQAGLKINDQIKVYNQSKANANAAQSLATSVANAQAVSRSVPVNAQVQDDSMFSGWALPLLIGGVGIVAIMAFRK